MGMVSGVRRDTKLIVDRDSSVGIATRHALDGLGTAFRWKRDVPHLSKSVVGAHPDSYAVGTLSFLGIGRPRRGVCHPPHLLPWLKKELSYTFSLPCAHRLFVLNRNMLLPPFALAFLWASNLHQPKSLCCDVTTHIT